MNTSISIYANLPCLCIILALTVITKTLHAQCIHDRFELELIMGTENNNDLTKTWTVPATGDRNDEVKNNTWSIRDKCRMIISLINQPRISKKALKNGPYDVIIVPGFPFKQNLKAGIILRMRIKWAHYLITKGIARNVIFSGSAVYTPYIESNIMGLFAMEMGIPAENIFYETEAEHSTENLVYSYRLAQELGFEKIAVATGPYQSSFLQKYANDHSIQLHFISMTKIFGGKLGQGKFPDIDPSSAYVWDFVNLKERESKEERYQGTLGNKIKPL